MKNILKSSLIASIFLLFLCDIASAQNLSSILSGTGGDSKNYQAKWSGRGVLRPMQYYQLGSKTFIHFSLNGSPWPNSAWGIDKTTWSISCNRKCILSGIGGDGKRYSAEWQGTGTLSPLQYYQLGSKTFIHFSLNGNPWPSSAWGVEQSSWSVETIDSK
jgi:hypothetical protein